VIETETQADERQLVSLNPATGDVVATFGVTGAAAVRRAVACARDAASWWGGLDWAARRGRLICWQRLIVGGMDELAELMRAEVGKPADDARLEIIAAVEHLHWAATHARRVLRPRRVAPGPLAMNLAATVEYEPLGVVGVIGPWNYPVLTPMGSLAFALAAGNAIVFKPSEYSPASGVWLARRFAEAVPEQPVLQVIPGYGATGAALCRAGVDKVAFTGSPATGRKIMATCAETLTPVVIEGGGKDAAIIDADADVAAAADAVAFGAMGNAGQTCVGIERAYVADAVYDEFLRRLSGIASRVRVGSADDAQVGPLTMPGQPEIVRQHIEDAIARGGRAVYGGPESVRPPYAGPVILTGVPEDSVAVTDETFGPTITVTRVADVDEAIAKANATRYGLGSAVFARDRRSALSIARRLRSGMASINSVQGFAMVSGLPFGGRGDSGFGRIHGADGLREFAHPKAITRQRFKPAAKLLSFDRTAKDMTTTLRLVRLLRGAR
jgi:succinate-semialdehyde dehydrogenase / glutarate-semialdehyde dehydrogenase